MIDQALKFVVERLNDHFGVDPPEVVSGSIPLDQQAPSVSSVLRGDKVVVSVVNIRIDHPLRNNPKALASQPDAEYARGYGSASPGLEILVLFSTCSSPGHYDLALRRISQIIEYFNGEPVFPVEAFPVLRSVGIRKLSLYFQSLTIEELYRIWRINGGRYFPSALYCMKIDLNESGHVV